MNCPYKTSKGTVDRILKKCGIMKDRFFEPDSISVIREIENVFQNQNPIIYLKNMFERATQKPWDDSLFLKFNNIADSGIEVSERNRAGLNTAVMITYHLIYYTIYNKKMFYNEVIPCVRRFVTELCSLDVVTFTSLRRRIANIENDISDLIIIENGEMKISPNHNFSKNIGSGLCPALITKTAKPNGEITTVVKYLLEIAHDTLCNLEK